MLRHMTTGAAQPQSDRRLTGVREEVKYLLSPAAGAEALVAISEHVPPKMVNGAADGFCLSIYLDTASRDFARAELERGNRSVKLRVKDYYAQDRGAPRFGDRVFLELKVRLGAMVEKSRFPIPRAALVAALRGELPPSGDPAEAAQREAFEESRAGRPLLPLVLTHYHRTTLEDRKAGLRITFDKLVSFHVPPKQLLDPGFLPARTALPPPLKAESLWIAEVKSLGSVPSHVAGVFLGRQSSDYSKFREGLNALADRGLLQAGPPTR